MPHTYLKEFDGLLQSF